MKTEWRKRCMVSVHTSSSQRCSFLSHQAISMVSISIMLVFGSGQELELGVHIVTK